MSNDVSRVYQFLAKQEDWVTKADKSGDGAITKSEFRQFMEDNFEWDGETTDAGKNDLINSFWKTIDTNKSTSKIKGTNVKNNNALDKNEQAAMENRIKMYEVFNEFTSTITAPSIIASTSEWKSSVTAGLSALVETAISQGKTAEELATILEEAAPGIQNKATADYCAVEYLNSTMKEIVNEYGYAYGSDNTLQGMLNTYIKSLTGDEDGDTIKSTVTSIVDAYLATAGLKEDNAVDLADYGYSANEESALNDLQQCILKKSLENNLAEIKNEADYSNYSTLYDNAVTEFISQTLANTKQGDFETAKNYGIAEFKATKAYADIETTVEVKNVMTGDELAKVVSSRISESLANIIQKDGRYLKVFSEIQSEATEKAIAGDFDSNGTLDSSKLIDWVVDQIESRISEFYPNGLGDMSIQDLNTMYDKLAAAALKEADDDKSLAQARDAAIQYCKALATKSNSLKTAISDILKNMGKDENYTTALNSMYPSEIEQFMTELKAKAIEIGDVSEFKVTGWNGLPADGTVMDPGSTGNYKISASIDTNGASLTQNATYSVVSTSGCTATCTDLGDLSITADSTSGHMMSVTVAVTVDGVEIGTQTISMTCERTVAGIANSIGNDAWGGSSEHLEVYGLPGVGDGKAQVTSMSFADLYNNNAVIMLHMKNNNDTYTGTVKDRLTSLCSYIVNALASKGLDSAKLNSAATTVIDTLMSNFSRKGSSDNNTEGIALGTRVSNGIKNGEFNGVVKFTDFKGKDYQVNMVSFKEVVDLILNAYGI